MPVRHAHPFRAFALILATISAGLVAVAPPAHAVAQPCSTAGTWQQGELNVYWLDVEQGDSQFVVGPTGKTMLIDLGETAWNSTGTNTKAFSVANKIRTICGVSGPVHLDYVMASHHHLDHIGYAANPNDTTTVGNGLYRLLTPAGENFTVGMLLDHDGGTWTDANQDSDCDVGTSASPAPETDWNNTGTTSQTAKRWICWLYGPAGQEDRANINGHVTRLVNSAAWPTIDMGTGVTAEILQANAKGVLQVDGVMPVSGDHSGDATPPSENDYSIAVKFTRGQFEYVTAGDTDGEYDTSSFGYTYNDVEESLLGPAGNVETIRANHHGSSHSSSSDYVATLAPETAFVSCGNNSFGHPGNEVLNNLRTVENERGVGADIYLANNPCDPMQADGSTPTDYTGTLNTNGDVRLVTTDGGNGYTVTYGGGSRSYATYAEGGGGGGGGPQDVRINEYLMAPNPAGNGEWVELYNPTAATVDVSGLYIDDIAGGGGAPRQIPAGTTILAGGRWVMTIPSGFLNNTGTEAVRYLAINGGETVYDSSTYNLGSTHYNKSLHRMGDGGAWCSTISANTTMGTPNPTSCP